MKYLWGVEPTANHVLSQSPGELTRILPSICLSNPSPSSPLLLICNLFGSHLRTPQILCSDACNSAIYLDICVRFHGGTSVLQCYLSISTQGNSRNLLALRVCEYRWTLSYQNMFYLFFSELQVCCVLLVRFHINSCSPSNACICAIELGQRKFKSTDQLKTCKI